MPETPSSSSLYPSVQFRFRGCENSEDIEILRYLKSFDREANSMVLEPVRAWWMPVACREKPLVRGDEALRKLAFQSVSALCSRARYLCSTFDLDLAAFGLSASGVVFSSFPVQVPTPPSMPSVGLTNSTPFAPGVVNSTDNSLTAPQDSLESDVDNFEDEIEGYSFYAASEGLHFNTAGL
jgi:hypothetical protein